MGWLGVVSLLCLLTTFLFFFFFYQQRHHARRRRTLLGNPDQSALIQTVVMVATTDLEDGEELFLNYRLNPKHQERLPPWYAPIDAEEDQRRWA